MISPKEIAVIGFACEYVDRNREWFRVVEDGKMRIRLTLDESAELETTISSAKALAAKSLLELCRAVDAFRSKEAP